MTPYLLFGLNGVRYAVDAMSVLEIVWLPELTLADEVVFFLSTLSATASHKAAEQTLNRQAEELRQHKEELERFNCATMGRDLDRIALEQHFNEVSHQLGQAPPCRLAFLNASAARPKGSEVQ
jgi:hypothetical protein